jgi:hypothetical protein
MFDIGELKDLLESRVRHALNNDGFQEDLTEDGHAFWFLYNIVPAAAGVYQYDEIIELLGVEADYKTYYVDTDEYDAKLAEVECPDYCDVYLGFWPDGGCFGVMMRCEND